MTRVRRLLGAATCTALALLGAAAVAPAASAADDGVAHYSYDQVVSSRNALAVGDRVCGHLPLPPGAGDVICGAGTGDLREGLNEAYYRHCGLDLHWTDEGPMSYDTSYRVVVCP